MYVYTYYTGQGQVPEPYQQKEGWRRFQKRTGHFFRKAIIYPSTEPDANGGNGDNPEGGRGGEKAREFIDF